MVQTGHMECQVSNVTEETKVIKEAEHSEATLVRCRKMPVISEDAGTCVCVFSSVMGRECNRPQTQPVDHPKLVPLLLAVAPYTGTMVVAILCCRALSSSAQTPDNCTSNSLGFVPLPTKSSATTKISGRRSRFVSPQLHLLLCAPLELAT